MVWYFHLLKNFPQFVVIHTINGFGVVNEAEVDVFLELSYFLYDPSDVGNLIFGSSAFSKSSLNIWNYMVTVHGGYSPWVTRESDMTYWLIRTTIYKSI